MAEEKTTKIKKKKWYQIVSPNVFKEEILGETLVAEPQLILGKTLSINLANLMQDSKQQNINVKFQVNEIRGENAHTHIVGYEVIPATIRRLVRRGKKRVDMSFVCETSDRKSIRIKPMLITKKTMKSSILAAAQKSIRGFLSENIKKMSYESLVSNLISHRLQHSLRDSIRKIYPFRMCEIREMRIEKKAAPEEKAKEPLKEEKKEEAGETKDKGEKKEAREEEKEEAKKEADKSEEEKK